MKHYLILLATDDSAVEAAVKSMETSSGCELKSVKTSREIASMVMDGALQSSLGVVDLDLKEGARAILKTMGGAMPVIAVAPSVNSWLTSMLDHRRVEVALVKPVSAEKMKDALTRLRSRATNEVSHEN